MSDAPVCENWMHFFEINFPSRDEIQGGSSATFHHQTATSTLVEVFLDAGLMSCLAERERLQERWLCYLAQGQKQ